MEFLDEFFKVDSRILRTARVLFRSPGQLTLDYAEGKKASYLAPFKLYFASSFVFYFVVEQLGLLDIAGSLKSGQPTESATQRGLIEGVTFYFNHLATISIIVLPFSALGLAIAFRNRNRPFLFHLIGTLHIVSAGFLMSIPTIGLVLLSIRVLHLNQLALLFGAVFAIVIGRYQQTAITRMYQATRWESRWKYSLSNLFGSLISAIALLSVVSFFVIREDRRDSAASPKPSNSPAVEEQSDIAELEKALSAVRRIPWVK